MKCWSRRDLQKDGFKMKKPKISIVIPAYNEEKYLPKLIRSIKKQKGVSYEIIVADNNSKDKTKEIAKKLGGRVVKGGMPAEGRNSGAKFVKGEYILFLDSDTLIKKDFLKDLIREVKKRNADAASGFFLPDNNNKRDHLAYTLASWYYYLLHPIFPAAMGFYLMVKQDFHKKIGGFDEKIKVAEDHEYARRAKKFGKIVFLRYPKIIVSNRRVEKEGFGKLIFKYIYSEIFYHILGIKAYKPSYKYEFGNYR